MRRPRKTEVTSSMEALAELLDDLTEILHVFLEYSARLLQARR